MYLYFIYNNLKVSPFLGYDAPFPGFTNLTWDHESYTFGTLFDIGKDAGFSKIGLSKVYGQLWVAKDTTKIKELEDFLGVPRLNYPTDVEVTVQINELESSKLKVTTFALEKIVPSYQIVEDGKWLIKRN